VVAERDRVRACGEHAVGESGRDAHSVGEVLAVDDARVGSQLGAEPVQTRLDRPSSRSSDNVGDEEDSQGSVLVGYGMTPSVAEGNTSIDTLLP
jgi:hypothetical protein